MLMRLSVVLLAALLNVAALTVQPGPNGFIIRYVPTKPGFGTPHTPPKAFPVKSGDLVCTDKTLDHCMVNHMPLLLQTNPALLAPLASYSTKYMVKSGANRGKIMWSEPQFSIGPTPYLPNDFANNIMGNGCYITSLTTVENAALANLPRGVTVGGRAVTFNKITANSLVAGAKPLNQLEWQYERWADKLQPNMKDPTQPSPTDFLELSEFAADLGPKAASSTVIDPSTITAKGLIDKLKARTYFVIEYRRYDVKASMPDKNGNIKLTLSYASHHKVAISGFQPGAYPLLIDDVGNGQRYRVRLTSSIGAIPLTEAVRAANPKSGGAIKAFTTVTLPASKLTVVNPPFPHTVYLVYEGQSVTINNGGEVFVPEGFDALTVGGPNSAR